jgi:hypothetical protein
MTLQKTVRGGPMSLQKFSQASFAGGPFMLQRGGPMTLQKTASAGPMSLQTGTTPQRRPPLGSCVVDTLTTNRFAAAV